MVMFIYHIIKMEITRVHEVFHVRVEDTSKTTIPTQNRFTTQILQHWRPFQVLVEDLKRNPGGGPEMIHPDTPTLEISGPPPGFRRLAPH
jgi:hypothetical protein